MTQEEYKEAQKQAIVDFRQYRAEGCEDDVIYDWLYVNRLGLFKEWQNRSQQSSTAGVFFNPASLRRN